MQNPFGTYIDAIIVTIMLYMNAGWCLYEDQIGKFDWRHQYIGLATHIFVERMYDKGIQLIALTEKNILASISIDTGDITWRHVLESGAIGKIDVCKFDRKITTTSKNFSMIRVWDSAMGYLKQETNIPKPSYDEKCHIRADGYLCIAKDTLDLYEFSGKMKKILSFQFQSFFNLHPYDYNNVFSSRDKVIKKPALQISLIPQNVTLSQAIVELQVVNMDFFIVSNTPNQKDAQDTNKSHKILHVFIHNKMNGNDTDSPYELIHYQLEIPNDITLTPNLVSQKSYPINSWTKLHGVKPNLNDKYIFIFDDVSNTFLYCNQYGCFHLDTAILPPNESKSVMRPMSLNEGLYLTIDKNVILCQLININLYIFYMNELELQEKTKMPNDKRIAFQFKHLSPIALVNHFHVFNAKHNGQIHTFVLTAFTNRDHYLANNIESHNSPGNILTTFTLYQFEKGDNSETLQLTKISSITLDHALLHSTEDMKRILAIPSLETNEITFDGINIIIQMSDGALLCLYHGQIKWIREESLSEPLSVDVIDLPIANKHIVTTEQSYLDASIQHPFILNRFAYRIYYQIFDVWQEAQNFMLNSMSHYTDLLTNIWQFCSQIFLGSVATKLNFNTFISSLLFGNSKFMTNKGQNYATQKYGTHAKYFDVLSHNRRDEGTLSQQQIFRDKFNIRKLIVITTKASKVFGIDSQTGNILYSLNLGKYIKPFHKNAKFSDDNYYYQLAMYQLRGSSHYPLPPMSAIIGKFVGPKEITDHNENNAKYAIVYFNPLTGALREPLNSNDELTNNSTPNKAYITAPIQGIKSMKQMLQTAILQPDHQLHYIRPIVILTEENMIEVYPKTGFDLKYFQSKYLANTYLYTVDYQSGLAIGYTINANNYSENDDTGTFQTTITFNTQLTSRKQIIRSIAHKNAYEKIDSPGKILEDRNVLYRYINPNLVAIVLECIDCEHDQFDIQLLDIVTGSIIYQVRHPKCHGPVHIINSENWIFYTYYSSRYRRREIAIIYMFQGNKIDKPYTLSSLNPFKKIPTIEARSFIFPLHCDITAISTTFTDLGLTQKKILVALSDGKIYEFSREQLDQFYMFQSQHNIPPQIHYIPEIPFYTHQIINYNQSVEGIQSIDVTPTGLESTSLILAYGLDWYSTRIVPSNYFDVLKDDFDRWIIIAVLIALVIASVVSKRMAARKELNLAWA